MLKRLPVLVLVGLAISTIWATSAFAQFSDVDPEHWAYDAVEYLAEQGFVVGYPDGTFKGNQTLTRYEFAMVIVRVYDQFLDMMDEDQDEDIATEAVIDMLMEEFQPELDELYALVQGNTERIEALEGTVGEYSDRIAQIEELADGMQTNFHPYGDITARFYGNYPEEGLQAQRAQYQLRFGFNADINDELTLGTMFVTGNEGERQSSFQTMDDTFGFDVFNVSRAFLLWRPESYDGFTMWAGKFAPPWIAPPMVWDSDVTVEGLAQQMSWNDFNFYLGEMVPAEEGFYLLAQVSVDDLLLENSTAAVTYHYINSEAWSHISADMMSGALTSKWDFSRLETPDDYRAIEGYWDWTSDVMDIPIQIKLNYLNNLEDTAPGLEEESGWQRAVWASLAFNDLKPVTPGEWCLWGEYGRVQANSVLTWLTNTTRGSGDTEFYLAGLKYRLLENTDVIFYYLNLEKLSVPQTTNDVVLVEFTSTFK